MSHFDAMQEILFVSHRKGQQTPHETLDRIFRKNLMMAGAPRQTHQVGYNSSAMTVELSTRLLKDVLGLCTRPETVSLKKRASKKVRHFPDVPVIICEIAGLEYLIDGNRRIRYFDELGKTEIQVYLCRIN